MHFRIYHVSKLCTVYAQEKPNICQKNVTFQSINFLTSVKESINISHQFEIVTTGDDHLVIEFETGQTTNIIPLNQVYVSMYVCMYVLGQMSVRSDQ